MWCTRIGFQWIKRKLCLFILYMNMVRSRIQISNGNPWYFPLSYITITAIIVPSNGHYIHYRMQYLGVLSPIIVPGPLLSQPLMATVLTTTPQRHYINLMILQDRTIYQIIGTRICNRKCTDYSIIVNY